MQGSTQKATQMLLNPRMGRRIIFFGRRKLLLQD
jgi:hypothetical protein